MELATWHLGSNDDATGRLQLVGAAVGQHLVPHSPFLQHHTFDHVPYFDQDWLISIETHYMITVFVDLPALFTSFLHCNWRREFHPSYYNFCP